MATKGEAIGQLVQKVCQLLEHHGVMTAAEAKQYLQQNNVTVDMVVWALQKYAKKPHEEGILRAYVARELKTAEVLAMGLDPGALKTDSERALQKKFVDGVLNNSELLDKLVACVELGLQILNGS